MTWSKLMVGAGGGGLGCFFPSLIFAQPRSSQIRTVTTMASIYQTLAKHQLHTQKRYIYHYPHLQIKKPRLRGDLSKAPGWSAAEL